MEQVSRHAVITDLEGAVDGSPLVTVSAHAVGGGVTTVLEQWSQASPLHILHRSCPDLSPQRPLAAFPDRTTDVTTAVSARDWPEAAGVLAERNGQQPTVFVIDDADHIDEASARLSRALLSVGCRIVLGHHHAPSTNPSLESLIDGVAPSEQTRVVVPPLSEAEVDAALGDGADPAAALSATAGNPLALSLYRGPAFASTAMAVLERFDRLNADGQGLAAILAASPEPLSFDLLEALARPWNDHGSQLRKSGLVAVHGEAVSFRHDKIRRVLYEEMTAVRRRFVHAEILSQSAESDDLALLMHHAVGAGDVETIVSYGPSAADEAAALGAHREAARHLENVLAYEHSVPEAGRPALKAALEEYLARAVG